MKRRGHYSHIFTFTTILAIASFAILLSDTTEAHTVPACCIGPDTITDQDLQEYCAARTAEKDKAQAPKSSGGDTVRNNPRPPGNKHCQPGHVSPGGPTNG
jgi:hypothetical protein